MAFKMSSFSLFLILVAKRPIAKNARSASTEVGLIVKRKINFSAGKICCFSTWIAKWLLLLYCVIYNALCH